MKIIAIDDKRYLALSNKEIEVIRKGFCFMVDELDYFSSEDDAKNTPEDVLAANSLLIDAVDKTIPGGLSAIAAKAGIPT